MQTTEPRPTVQQRAPRQPFAARVQAVLIVAMFVCLVLIAQQVNKTLYQFGLPLLVLAAFLQIAFGNISPAAGVWRSVRVVAITGIIVVAVFLLSIELAPTLIDLTR